MKIELTQDWAEIEQVMNAPEVLAGICHDGKATVDMAELQQGNRIFLRVVQRDVTVGVFMLVRALPGIYEVHTCLTAACRGAAAVRAGQLGADWMFVNTDAQRLYSFCPDSNRASLFYAYAVGFRHAFRRPEFWTKNGVREGATVVQWEVQDWAYRRCGSFQPAGHHFHEQVFANREHHHAEDPLHDGMVGLALGLGGRQPGKAMQVYNTWAVGAGYAPVSFMGRGSDGRMVVDIRDALIAYDPDVMKTEILKGY
jgi:hypothetical protein